MVERADDCIVVEYGLYSNVNIFLGAPSASEMSMGPITIGIRNGTMNSAGAKLDERHREAKYTPLYLTGQ